MCQSRGGVRRTALISLALALPVFTAAQAASLENDGTGPGLGRHLSARFAERRMG